MRLIMINSFLLNRKITSIIS